MGALGDELDGLNYGGVGGTDYVTADGLDVDVYGHNSRPGSFVDSNAGDPVDQEYRSQEGDDDDIIVKDLDIDEIDAAVAQPDIVNQDA